MSTKNTKISPEKSLTDKQLEKFLTIASHYTFAELDELVPFDKKNDEERNEIMKVVVKTIESSVIVASELFKASSVDDSKLDNVFNLLNDKKFDEAYGLLKP
ncbi:MAG: hypothetical protein HON90_01925 [Halobacteriovoraceae bacterium]|jgi:hypothetical protein|nr:hypothetical protein [Halobacteriovoraceae bacterium]